MVVVEVSVGGVGDVEDMREVVGDVDIAVTIWVAVGVSVLVNVEEVVAVNGVAVILIVEQK